MQLEGRVAIVTGAAKGIGSAVAHRLAREGAVVVVADVDTEHGQSVADSIVSSGAQAVFLATDVRRSDTVDATVADVLRRFGSIDILVNCAGGPAGKGVALFHESEEEVWDEVIGLNLKGTRNCCRAVVGPMMQQKSGCIVNIGSTAATGAFAKLADYCAAKAGVLGFTRALALELIGHGIRVNSVSPGSTNTPAIQARPEVIQERHRRSTGFGRLARVEEIANVVAFLVSDEASFVSGQDYAVCGIGNLSSFGMFDGNQV